MIVRVVRLFIPTAGAALRGGFAVQTARIHSGSPSNLQYGWWAYALGERTTPRFKENSKIISIDGNLASGKGALVQKLADKLGMMYMPEPDTHYLDKMTGEKEPLDTRFNGNCSLEKFYRDPKAADGNSYRLQSWMYHVRLLHYSDAIEHLLTTGQGVVLERSPFSDLVFLEAMAKQGYIRKQCVDHYNEIRGISLCEFLPPHLVIYLDVPAEEVQKKLKQSGEAYLQNIPLPYLKSIEDAYKKTFLPQISTTSEVLVYDTAQAQDIEKVRRAASFAVSELRDVFGEDGPGYEVAEDIEYLKFDKGPWLEQDDVTFHYMRMLVEDKQRVANLTCIANFLPEVTIGAHDNDASYYAYQSLPGKKYAPGYNADVGDKNIWLK